MDSSSLSPHHRHQSSREGVIADRRAQAKGKFYSIVNHFEAGNKSDQYNRPKLVRLTYEYARSEESRDIFLRAFFQAMALSIDDEDVDLNNNELEDFGSALFNFADYLFDNFFLPLRASAKKTPQPSPAYHSAIQRAQGGGVQDFVGTPGRMSELRGDCLTRDRHRCVISRRFDMDEVVKRIKRNKDEAKDDDGNLLQDEAQFEKLEVAHILPHALTRVEPGSELHPSKKAALDILNMFDYGVIHLIEGDDIDRPKNAITLTPTLHGLFGNFNIFFEPVSDAESHTYRIDTFLLPFILRDVLPITRTLYLTENRTIDPPSPRLLALHCAIAHILHLSAAADYIDKVLDDMEKSIRADGSTELGRLVTLGLGGWLDRTVCA